MCIITMHCLVVKADRYSEARAHDHKAETADQSQISSILFSEMETSLHSSLILIILLL